MVQPSRINVIAASAKHGRPISFQLHSHRNPLNKRKQLFFKNRYALLLSLLPLLSAFSAFLTALLSFNYSRILTFSAFSQTTRMHQKPDYLQQTLVSNPVAHEASSPKTQSIFAFSQNLYITLPIYMGGVFSGMVIALINGIGDATSNPWQDWLHSMSP